jgi:hypothetical protein
MNTCGSAKSIIAPLGGKYGGSERGTLAGFLLS